MGIEKHELPHPPPAEAGANLARLLDGLTRTVLDLLDEAPAQVQAIEEVAQEAPVEEPAPVPEPRAERRPGNVLNELSFLDD